MRFFAHPKIHQLILLFCALTLMVGCFPVDPTPNPDDVLKQLDTALEKYNAIKLGMTDAELVQVMGNPGEDPLADRTPKPGDPPAPEGFLKKFDEGYFETGVAFGNGKVIIKSFNWTSDAYFPIPAPSASVENYDQVEIGMTYDEVVALLGSSGLAWSIKNSARPGMSMTGAGLDMEVNTFTTDHQVITYMWLPEGTGFSELDRMLITFAEGKVMMKSFHGKTIAE